MRVGRVLAAHRFQRAGDDKSLPGQRHVGDGRTIRRFVFHAHAGGCQPIDQRRVRRLVEERANRLCNDRADVGHDLKLLERGRPQRRHRSERTRQRTRATLADVTDADGVEQPRQFAAAAARRFLQSGSRPTSCPSDRARRLAPRSAHRGPHSRGRGRSSRADRPATRQALRCSWRGATRSARARGECAPGHDAFSQRQTTSSSGFTRLLLAERTRGRHLPLRRIAFAPLEHRPEHFRDDVAALLDADVITFADVAARDFLFVVQRRHRHESCRSAARARARRRA